VTRTVVKANYRFAGGGRLGGARSKMNASGAYYASRPNELGERQERQAFTLERDDLNREEWREEVQQLEGRFAYRMVLSPGEELRGEALKAWTRETLQSLDNHGSKLRWVGWSHEDQTKHPHVHVIGFSAGRLEVPDFERVRVEGDRQVQQVLERQQSLSRDPMREEWDREREAQRQTQEQPRTPTQEQIREQTRDQSRDQNQDQSREQSRNLKQDAERARELEQDRCRGFGRGR
jgi:hypothetical protein